MLRSWQDVVEKWQLVPSGGDAGPSAARERFDKGRSALLAGRVDEARAEFEAAARLRSNAYDEVGIGDVYLTRGEWRSALVHYDRADERDPGNLAAALGRSQALVAAREAERAAELLEADFGDSDHPVVRYYLASTWCSVAEQVRGRTSDDVLVITSERQLDVCESAARRIQSLDVADTELRRGAELLLDEVATARRWRWHPEGIAVSLAVLAVSIGLILVALGGLAGNPLVVIAGVVLGSALLYLIVTRFRRQNWRTRADELADRLL